MSNTTEVDHMEFWERLARAETHALRIRILENVKRIGSASPSQLSLEMDEPLGNVSYHVTCLVKAGMLTLKRTMPRRGAVEHFYQATPEEAPGSRVGDDEAVALERIEDALFEALVAGVTPEQLAFRATTLDPRKAVAA